MVVSVEGTTTPDGTVDFRIDFYFTVKKKNAKMTLLCERRGQIELLD